MLLIHNEFWYKFLTFRDFFKKKFHYSVSLLQAQVVKLSNFWFLVYLRMFSSLLQSKPLRIRVNFETYIRFIYYSNDK